MPLAALKKKSAPSKPALKPKPTPAPPVLAAPARMQAKLEVGRAGDRFEQEADRTADSVMRMPDSAIAIAAAPLQISRQCTVCEREETDDKLLQKKSAGPAEANIGGAPASVHAALRSPGRPLDDASRAYFEPRFGQEFGEVRVHTGMVAAQSARDVSAHAYTVGQNIVFAAGRFAPATQSGRRLIAHELTHVVQQSGTPQIIRRAPANYPSNQPLPAKTDVKRDTPSPQVSNDDLIGIMVSLREQSPQDFLKLLAGNEDFFYRLLSPYGFHGSWTKDEAYLADFDAAVKKWGKASVYLQKFGSVRAVPVQPKPKSREERQYEDAQYLVIDMNRHGYRRGEVNDALESAGLMEDLEAHGFERVSSHSFKDHEVYAREAIDALNGFIGRYQTAHNIILPTTASVPTPDPAEYYRVWLEGLNYITSSFVGAEFAELASKFTDDPRKITAAAGLGAAVEGAAGSFAMQPGSYSPEVENKPSSVVLQELRYSGTQPIKSPVDPTKVAPPPLAERIPPPDLALSTPPTPEPQIPAPAPAGPSPLPSGSIFLSEPHAPSFVPPSGGQGALPPGSVFLSQPQVPSLVPPPPPEPAPLPPGSVFLSEPAAQTFAPPSGGQASLPAGSVFSPEPIPPAHVPEDIRGIVDPSGGITIRGAPSAQPTKEAVSRAEQAVTAAKAPAAPDPRVTQQETTVARRMDAVKVATENYNRVSIEVNEAEAAVASAKQQVDAAKAQAETARKAAEQAAAAAQGRKRNTAESKNANATRNEAARAERAVPRAEGALKRANADLTRARGNAVKAAQRASDARAALQASQKYLDRLRSDPNYGTRQLTVVQPERTLQGPSGGTIVDHGYEGARGREFFGRLGLRSSRWAHTDANYQLMLDGRPPVGEDGAPINLHHRTRGPMSRLDEYTQTQHRELNLHEPGLDSEIDRREFDRERERYWVQRARDLLDKR